MNPAAAWKSSVCRTVYDSLPTQAASNTASAASDSQSPLYARMTAVCAVRTELAPFSLDIRPLAPAPTSARTRTGSSAAQPSRGLHVLRLAQQPHTQKQLSGNKQRATQCQKQPASIKPSAKPCDAKSSRARSNI